MLRSEAFRWRVVPGVLARIGALTMLGILALTGCSSTIGLVPVTPKQGKSVASNELVLAWEEAPAPADDVYYQLLIQNEAGASVYEQSELRETRHVVTAQLKPGRYQWTVRPVYLRNGEWAPGEWTMREWTHFYVVFITWGKGLYEFKVVQEDASEL
jgi:hypothetical protein